MPVRYSSIVWWDDGLHTNRKCPPAPPRKSADGRAGRRPDRPASAGRGAARDAPASRSAFTVLLLMAVLGHDEFRLQRHHPVVIGRHDRRRHQRVEVLGPVLAALAARALLAMDLARHVIFGAVQGDQYVAAKLPESLQAARSLQFGHHLGEDRMKVVGADRVQQCPDMIVAGDLIETEQRLAVRADLVRNPGMVSNETSYGAWRFHHIVFQRCVRCLPILSESFEKLGQPRLSSQSATRSEHRY